MDVPKFKTENIGSVLRIDVLPVQDFLSFIPHSPTTISSGGLVLLAGAAWINIYCTEGTMGLQYPKSISENGESYKNLVIGFTPGDDQAIHDALQQFNNTKVVAMVLTANGNYRIVGSPDQPL